MAFSAKDRLSAYTAILTQQEPLTPEQLLSLNDMINEDLTGREVAENRQADLEASNQSLRDTNHKLFLRVTGGQSPTEVEGPELSEDEQAEDAFNKLIKEGVL